MENTEEGAWLKAAHTTIPGDVTARDTSTEFAVTLDRLLPLIRG
jgi:hypothetical protein